MNHQKYDIAIIGGGLAGLSFSILAADAGYSVVLFEKENYPFHKVCGEYISFESFGFLRRMGVPLDEMNLPVIKKLQLSDVKGNNYFFKLPLGGFGISRYTLDNTLYHIALQKGVTVFTDSKITDLSFKDDTHIVETNNSTFFSRIAVAAYGKRSNVDIKWKRKFVQEKPDKLNNYIGVKYHIRYSHLTDTVALHNFQNGYCGISNIEEDKCCLCYLTTAENLKANNNSVQQMEKLLLQKNPFLNQIFIHAEFLYNSPLVISQISFTKKTQIENHVLLIGDAAGMITPLCGNGMSMAMHAAKIAFENAHYFLKQKINRAQLEERYAQQWNAAFKKRLFTGRIVQRFFGNNSTTSLFLKVMHTMPAVANKIIELTHGSSF